MKILFISRLYLPHLGGVEVHLKEIASILIKMGHEVNILTLQHDKKLKLEAEYDGVKVVRLPFEVSENKTKTWQAIKKHEQLFLDADIVHIHDVFWWIIPVYLKLRHKIFLTFHGWETMFPIPFGAKIHRLVAAKLVKGTIHVGSYIRKFYFDKPDFVIYGGINPKRFTKSGLEFAQDQMKNIRKEFRFVFVGRLDEDNDVNKNIKFLKKLKNKKINFNVTWVGDGRLIEKCKKFGKVTGFVKNISKYIVDSDFVLASSYLSILEAQCLGKVVLAFYSNPLKKEYLETFPGSKYMLISGSTNSMLAKLEHLFTARKLHQQMGEDAKLFTSNFTWDKVVGKYLKLWKNKLY